MSLRSMSGRVATKSYLTPTTFPLNTYCLKTKNKYSACVYFISKGFRLNESGGTIKGGPQDMLEQSSTMADRIGWSFENNIIAEIPSCYVEFALRYYDDSGVLFDGFVPDSATRIFESTHRV